MTTRSNPRSTRRRALIGTTAVAVTGLAVGAGVSLAGAPAASAAPLPAFGDCDELLQWYVDRALPAVGPYGLGGYPVPMDAWPMAMEDSSGAGVASGSAPVAGERVTSTAPMARDADGQSASGTGTNVQETGVDEPDVAKTDGRLLVRVVDRELRVTRVDAAREGEVDDVGVLGLPEDLQASEVLLSGDRVLVVGATVGTGGVVAWGAAESRPMVDDVVPSAPGQGTEPAPLPAPQPKPLSEPLPEPLPAPEPRPFVPPVPSTQDTSRVVEVDLTDPAEPRVLSDRTYGGSLVSARQYDADGRSVVRLVLHTGLPTLDFVQPDRDRTEQQATAENRSIVRRSTLRDWLPQVRDTAGTAGTGDDLLECDDVRHPLATDPADPAGQPPDGSTDSRGFMAPLLPDLGTLSVVTLPFSNPTDTSATAVTTSAQTVYSSTDRLYLALNGPEGTTQVHAFALDGDETRYVASGSVPGLVRDRWSMDEQDGVLRLAVGYGGWSAADNGVVTLREAGGRLTVLGSVRGLGPQEEIKSVRWLDDLAVVVTFRQTDPLYTVDLSDPARPRTLGALKIPGFSTYLHPLGDDRLLGIGQDASPDGQVLGSQASVFDVSDLRDPRRLSRLPLDGEAMLAEYEPRALTWVPEAGVVLAGTSSEVDGHDGIVELRVGDDGRLARGRSWTVTPSSLVGTPSPRALPLGEGRVALVGAGVRVVEVS